MREDWRNGISLQPSQPSYAFGVGRALPWDIDESPKRTLDLSRVTRNVSATTETAMLVPTMILRQVEIRTPIGEVMLGGPTPTHRTGYKLQQLWIGSTVSQTMAAEMLAQTVGAEWRDVEVVDVESTRVDAQLAERALHRANPLVPAEQAPVIDEGALRGLSFVKGIADVHASHLDREEKLPSGLTMQVFKSDPANGPANPTIVPVAREKTAWEKECASMPKAVVLDTPVQASEGNRFVTEAPFPTPDEMAESRRRYRAELERPVTSIDEFMCWAFGVDSPDDFAANNTDQFIIGAVDVAKLAPLCGPVWAAKLEAVVAAHAERRAGIKVAEEKLAIEMADRKARGISYERKPEKESKE